MDPAPQQPPAAKAGEPLSDRFVDDLLPEELDWRRMVRSYPLPVLAAAAVGGFLLGRRHGDEIVAALRSFIDREVAKNVQSFLGEADAAE